MLVVPSLRTAVFLVFLVATCVKTAVVEVTAGGHVNEPTYMFSDITGFPLATLKGSSTALTASTDVVTGNGNSVDTLATTIATLQATIDDLALRLAAAEATIFSLTYPWVPVSGASMNCAARQAGAASSNMPHCAGTRTDAGLRSLDSCKQLCISQPSCLVIQWQGLVSHNFGYSYGQCFWLDHSCATLSPYDNEVFCLDVYRHANRP